jgi:hypothetical protein
MPDSKPEAGHENQGTEREPHMLKEGCGIDDHRLGVSSVQSEAVNHGEDGDRDRHQKRKKDAASQHSRQKAFQDQFHRGPNELIV